MSLNKNLREPKPITLPENLTAEHCDPAVLAKWNSGLRARAADDASTISILDRIGEDILADGVTPKRIRGALRSIGEKPVTVLINSPGGDFFDGLAIYNMLREHPAKVTVKVLGIAASAAAIIAMAGDQVQIPEAGFLMIHNTQVAGVGDRHTMLRAHNMLAEFDAVMAGIFADRSGQPEKTIAEMLDAATYIDGARAVELGFADSLLADSDIREDTPDPSALALRTVEAALKRDGHSRSQARALLREVRRLPAEAGSRDDRRAAAGDLADSAAELIRALTSN